MTLKRVLTVAAVFIGAVVLLIGAVFAWMLLQHGNVGSGKNRETVNQQSGWVQEYMLRNLRSIVREDGGVRIESADPEHPILYRAVTDPPNSYDRLRRGNSVWLAAGDAMVNPDYHGSQSYTIRQVLPDRIIVDYHSSHNIMSNSSVDTGTVELAYRTSTPLNTRDANRTDIARLLAQQIKSLQPATDGKAVEIVAVSPQNFWIRSKEVTHRMDRKTADRSALAVSDGIEFGKPDAWTMVTVKEILPGAMVFEYRSVFDYKGMKGEDKGRLEIPWRDQVAAPRDLIK